MKSIYKLQLLLLQKYKTYGVHIDHVAIAEMEISDQQKLGVGLGGFGVFFLLLGVLMLFDKGLLAIGNLFCIAGFVLCVGFERTGRFFGQVERLKGTACFLGGIFILLLGWPVIGIILEVYGFVTLFGGFMPMVRHFHWIMHCIKLYNLLFIQAINFLRCVPVVSTLLALPGISGVCDSIVASGEARE